jgi:hypothetical protein
VEAGPDFDPQRVRRTHFAGRVRLNRLQGGVRDASGAERPAMIADARLENCTLEADVRVSGVRVGLRNYHVQSGACLEDVGLIEATPNATFGNGLELAPVNEAGGRPVTLFHGLSAQFAYLQAIFRERPRFAARLAALAEAAAREGAEGPATIGCGAALQSVDRVIDVRIGPAAVIRGATALENGAVLSGPGASTYVGPAVIARGFLIGEGATVSDGALLARCFVGQGCRIGNQFSAENSLFFANCEAFHGEACSVFAGPYTVTHHKGTLLIAGCFSFYNAGSGTNQSNHMYKLGPVHEGKLERGCKTGSFSYLMWPCRIGPFSVVLGKHTRAVDTRDFPFSHLEATPDGRCELTPGLYLNTVGTLRDAAKWPSRDRRQGCPPRDRVNCAVISPYTAGRMLRGMEKLSQLHDTTPRSVRNVTIDGAEVRRVLLRTGVKFYRSALELYLLDQAVRRAADAEAVGKASSEALSPHRDAVFSEEWVDVAGQLMPRARLDALADAVEEGRIATAAAVEEQLDRIQAACQEDEWAWAAWAFARCLGTAPAACDPAERSAWPERRRQLRRKFLQLILADAEKEFAPSARVGYGLGDDSARDAEFAVVRGRFADDGFVKILKEELRSLEAP